MDYRRAEALCRFDLLDDIDVMDALVPDDIVSLAIRLLLDAPDDHSAKIPNVKRLPQILAVARDRKHWCAGHEARQPAEMLRIEPSKHQRRTKHAVSQSRRADELLLGALGPRVVVIGDRYDHGRADVHEKLALPSLQHVEKALGRGDVVADKRLWR